MQEGPSAEEIKAAAEAERKLKEHAEAFLGVVSDSLTCLLTHLACACTWLFLLRPAGRGGFVRAGWLRWSGQVCGVELLWS